jgi:hypothetical protein
MKKLFLVAGAGMMMALGVQADAKPGKGQGRAKVVKVQPTKVKTVEVKTVKVKSPKRSWLTACPRGLVWRGPSCVPPGQARNLLGIGTRVPPGWSYTPWGGVPLSLRNQYALDPTYRYVYRDKVIYVVDPRTRLVTSIIDGVL